MSEPLSSVLKSAEPARNEIGTGDFVVPDEALNSCFGNFTRSCDASPFANGRNATPTDHHDRASLGGPRWT